MTERRNCFTVDLIILNVALACIDGLLAITAFAQVLRIHMRNQQNDWTRQKFYSYGLPQSSVFGSISPPPIILENEEEEEDEDNVENRTRQALLEGIKWEHGSASMKDYRRCCSIPGIHIGSRQKYVIVVEGMHIGICLVMNSLITIFFLSKKKKKLDSSCHVILKLFFLQIVVLIFVVMMSFAMLIWIGDDKNPINPSVVARVYETFLAVMILILAGALGCYGLLLFFRLRKVRTEKASSEMWKVVTLAIISVICFSSSALVALNTDIPLFYHWHLKIVYGVKAFVFLILYYFVGSSLPSAYLLWIIRELPPPVTDSVPEQPRTITFISHAHEASGSNQPRLWE